VRETRWGWCSSDGKTYGVWCRTLHPRRYAASCSSTGVGARLLRLVRVGARVSVMRWGMAARGGMGLVAMLPARLLLVVEVEVMLLLRSVVEMWLVEVLDLAQKMVPRRLLVEVLGLAPVLQQMLQHAHMRALPLAAQFVAVRTHARCALPFVPSCASMDSSPTCSGGRGGARGMWMWERGVRFLGEGFGWGRR
jgi:hypothetical protein